ncbi:MAG: hypothetical protein RJP95_03815 [Pirellulales bacterium]
MHFIWIADVSGSMAINGKIQSLNTAIKEAIPAMVHVTEENPFVEMLVRTVAFSSGAHWHDPKPTEVHSFRWRDLSADGVTDMGAAFKLVAEELTVERMDSRGYPPVLVLISDGGPTDNYKQGLEALIGTPWGKRAARVAIAIGQDATHEPLSEFIGNIEFPVLQANNAATLTNYIKWVSAEVSKAASAPASRTQEKASDNATVSLPPPPLPSKDEDDDDDVW